MPRDMFFYIPLIYLATTVVGMFGLYIHIGVGSALLVSNNRVMRRPLERETSNRYRFSRFFVLNCCKRYTAESGELIGTRDRTIFLINNYKFYYYAKNETLADNDNDVVV